MLKASSFAGIALLLCGCGPDPKYLHVVQATKSPDGGLTAAYVEDTQGGAAVGTGQDVYVFEGSSPTRYADRVFSDECVKDVRVSWLQPKVLQIAYGARLGHRTLSASGPWWTFGHVPHGLTIRLAPHPTDSTYC